MLCGKSEATTLSNFTIFKLLIEAGKTYAKIFTCDNF